MNKYIIPLSLALAFFLVGLFTLSDYGIIWGAPHRMIRGQVYLDKILGTNVNGKVKQVSPIIIEPGEYMSRFDPLDGEGITLVKLPERPLFEINKGESFYTDSSYKQMFSKVEGHPPLIDILGALSNRIFYSTLGILDDIRSQQVVYLLI